MAAAIATGISFIASMAMWGAMFGGGRDDDEGANPFALLLLAILAPMAAGLLQMALTRSREFEADRTGAQLIGDGEPLARALLKLEAAAKRIPMNVQPAQAQTYIVNPLTGRKVQFRPALHHPPTDRGPGRAPPYDAPLRSHRPGRADPVALVERRQRDHR